MCADDGSDALYGPVLAAGLVLPTKRRQRSIRRLSKISSVVCPRLPMKNFDQQSLSSSSDGSIAARVLALDRGTEVPFTATSLRRPPRRRNTSMPSLTTKKQSDRIRLMPKTHLHQAVQKHFRGEDRRQLAKLMGIDFSSRPQRRSSCRSLSRTVVGGLSDDDESEQIEYSWLKRRLHSAAVVVSRDAAVIPFDERAVSTYDANLNVSPHRVAPKTYKSKRSTSPSPKVSTLPEAWIEYLSRELTGADVVLEALEPQYPKVSQRPSGKLAHVLGLHPGPSHASADADSSRTSTAKKKTVSNEQRTWCCGVSFGHFTLGCPV